LDDDTPVAQIVQGSQTVETARYKFTATSDTYTIQELKVQIASGAENVVEAIRLLDGTTLLGSLTPDGSRQAHFTGLNKDVAAGVDKVLRVELVLNEIDDTYDRTAKLLQTSLVADSVYYLDSAGTQTTTGLPAAILNGNTIYVYKTIPTVTKVAETDSFANKALYLYTFSVTPPSTEGIELYKLTFDVGFATSTSGTKTINTLKLYRGTTELVAAGDATTSVSSVTQNLDGTNDTLTITFPEGENIPANTTYTYKLRGTVSGFGQSATYIPDTVSFYLKGDTAWVDSGIASAISKNFVWSDKSAPSHSTSTADWAGSYELDNLPLDDVTWSY